MATWKEEMQRQARYVRAVRPDAYTMSLPEDKEVPRMQSSRKVVLESDLGNLQAFGVPDKDLRTIERSINQHKRVEMEEITVGIRPVTTIYIDGVFFIKVEGY